MSLFASFFSSFAALTLVALCAGLFTVCAAFVACWVLGKRVKALRSEQSSLHRELQGLSEAAKERDVFVSMLIHELRSPLTVLTLHLEMAQLNQQEPRLSKHQAHSLQHAKPPSSSLTADKSSDSDLGVHLSQSLQAVRQLSALVNDLLDTAQIRANRFTTKRSLTSVHQLVREVFESFTLTAHSKQLSLELQIEPNAPNTLCIDGRRLKQVLINLVDNALKYTAQGFVKITLGVQKKEQENEGDVSTELQTPLAYSAIFLSVQDSGPGLSEAQRQSIFEPFNDVRSMSRDLQSTTSHAEHTAPSTGLGMAIVKSLAGASGWDIQVQSQLQSLSSEHGTTFTLILPVQP